ncbi:MAG: alkaline phosphatase family protein, partial [Candidatus Eisenbacteria bacterium]|nr:alkaline phosphatase family protein [Candidatus Eisenbacteria bacterium]
LGDVYKRQRRAWLSWRRARWLSVLALLALAAIAGCGRKRASPLVIIGLDGASWDLLEPWIAAGDLPNLKAFRDGANWGTMRSVVPYLSPPAWTSAVTGVNPGRHGIYDFQRRLPGDAASFAATPQARPIVTETSKSRRSPPIWNLLKGSGKRVAIINIPMTDPPDEVDGIMIAGFPHLDQEGYAWPRPLEARCRQAGYLLDEMEMKLPPGQEESLLATFARARDTRWALAKQLYQEEEYDLFWIVFTGVDRVQHLYWIFDDPKNPKHDPVLAQRFAGSMHRFWKDQDRILGEFLGLIRPGSTVMMVSDHGFGPIRRELRVGTWVRTAASGFSTAEAVQVFTLDRSDAARLYVREPGRDPGADLSREQAQSVRERLASGLRGVTDPETGEAPVEALYRGPEVFVGKYAEKGPDLTAVPSSVSYTHLRA